MLKMGSSKSHTTVVMPSGTRWLVIGAGCFCGLVGFLHYGWFFVFVPIILIFGAVVQPWFNRLGRWLLALGAFIVTIYGMFFAVPAVELIGRLPLHHSLEEVVFLLLFLVTVLLIVWCDVALIMEERKSRRSGMSTRN
jgi:hypothetical protein